jgi:protein-disulfide isomerase
MYKTIKASLIAALITAGSPVFALDLDAMTPVEKEQFGQQVREYLLENPEIMIEVFSILEQRQQAAETKDDAALIANYIDEIQNDGYSWVGGNPDGDITMVEFMDYKCGYCRKAHKDVADIVKSDGNIKLVIKEYPILGEDSYNLSRAAIATLHSLGPDAYKKMYDQFIEHNGPVTNSAIEFLAKKVGLDGAVIIAQLDQTTVNQQIRKTRQLGETLKITGTPAFIINDQIVRGYIPRDAMKQVIAELRSQTQ